MSAAENRRSASARWLLHSAGCDPNAAMAATGWTALHAAAKVGDLAILEMLLEAGGDPDMRASHRHAFLHKK